MVRRCWWSEMLVVNRRQRALRICVSAHMVPKKIIATHMQRLETCSAYSRIAVGVAGYCQGKHTPLGKRLHPSKPDVRAHRAGWGLEAFLA